MVAQAASSPIATIPRSPERLRKKPSTTRCVVTFLLLLWTGLFFAYAFPSNDATVRDALETSNATFQANSTAASPAPSETGEKTEPDGLPTQLERTISAWSFLPGVVRQAYVATCVLALLAFVALGRRRRISIVAFASLFVVGHFRIDGIGWDRVLLAAVVPFAATFIYEALRQNISLYKRFRKQSTVAISALAGRTIKVWWFMLVLLAVAWGAHHYLERRLQAFVYSAGPVNQYCSVMGSPSLLVPCENVDLKRAKPEVEQREQALSMYIDDRFAVSLQGWLARLESADHRLFASPDALAKAFPWETLDAAGIVGLDPTVLERDSELLELALERQLVLAEVEHLRTELTKAGPKPHVWLQARALAEFRQWQTTTAAIQIRLDAATSSLADLDKRASARKKALLEAPASMDKLLNDALKTAVGVGAFSAEAMQVAMATESDPYVRRAVAMREVAKWHDDQAQAAQLTVSETMRQWGDKPRTSDQLQAIATYYDDKRRLYCTFRQDGIDEDGRTHQSINSGWFRCPNGPNKPPALVLEPKTVRESIYLSLDAWIKSEGRALDQRYVASLRQVDEAVKAGRDTAEATADLVPRSIDLGRGNCHGYLRTPLVCIENKIKEKSEDSYRDARADADRKFKAKAAATAADASHAGYYKASMAHEKARIMLDEVAEQGHLIVDRAIDVLRVAGLVGWIFLAMTVIKSLLAASGIVLFDKTGIAGCTLEGVSVGPQLVSIKKELELPPGVTFESKNVMQNQMKLWRFLPRPLVSVLPRLRHGCYLVLNKGAGIPPHTDAPAGQQREPMRVRQEEDRYLVHWTLSPGEEVVFDYKHFFAISENVELLSEVSLRVSTLPLGRMLFCVAWLPADASTVGHLILSVRGRPVTQGVAVTELERIIAWSSHASFRLSSKVNGRAMWWHGTSVEIPTEGDNPGTVIVSPVNQGADVFLRLWNNLRTALSPF